MKTARVKQCILATVLLVAVVSFARSQAGVGVGTDFSSLDSQEKKEKKPKQLDLYVVALSERYHLSQSELAKLWFRGYGRNELIKLAIISRDSGKTLKDLSRLRDKNTRFSEIAKQFKLDYSSIMNEAARVRKELDYDVATASDSLRSRIHYSTATATSSPTISTSTAVEVSTTPAHR